MRARRPKGKPRAASAIQQKANMITMKGGVRRKRVIEIILSDSLNAVRDSLPVALLLVGNNDMMRRAVSDLAWVEVSSGLSMVMEDMPINVQGGSCRFHCAQRRAYI